MMELNFASKTKQSTVGNKSSLAQANVEMWVKQRGELLFHGDPNTQLIVMEVACNDPNCAPIDTVIILKSENIPEEDLERIRISGLGGAKEEGNGLMVGKWIGKIPKPTKEVTEEDIELLFIPESLTKEGLERCKAMEEELEASKTEAEADENASEQKKEEEKKEDDGELVEVTIDDGWLGRRTMMVRRARVPPPQEEDPKHRKGKGPTGCPCCDPDMFDLLMTRPPV